MRVSITAPIVHRCPFVDEMDIGTVTAAWDGDKVELHLLAHVIRSYADLRMTHEEVVDTLAEWIDETGGEDVTVVGQFTTAGLTVTVAG